MRPNSPLVEDLDFSYHVQDDSISCNHCYLTRGVPARLLTKLLEKYLDERRSYFEYREFKRDRDLFPQPKTTNFEIRLVRLMKVVRTHFPQFRFEIVGPGKFHFSYAGGGRLKIRAKNEPSPGMQIVHAR